MKYYSIILYSACLLLLGSSCTRHYYYSPHSTHQTQISEEGELTVSAAAGKVGYNDYEDEAGQKDNQFQIQAGYSPIKHLAVASSISFSEKSNRNLDVASTEGYDADFAIGSYFFVNSLTKKDREEIKEKHNAESPISYREKGFLFDAYLTYGRGRMINNYDLSNTDVFVYNRYGMQFGAYYRTRPRIGSFNTSFSMGMIVRPAFLEFSKAHIIGESTSRTTRFVKLVNSNNQFRIAEYTLTGQLGVGSIRLFGNINWITSQEPDLNYYIDNQAFQAGILFEVDRLFNFKKQKKQNKLIPENR